MACVVVVVMYFTKSINICLVLTVLSFNIFLLSKFKQLQRHKFCCEGYLALAWIVVCTYYESVLQVESCVIQVSGLVFE